jgi:O-acetyl-ADP-ribose deacetylase (regulator of RNase III)
MQLQIIQGDITKIKSEAIVNAANKTLLGGGGVDAAIHKAAGPKLLEECKNIRKNYPQGLPTGKAVITKGYNLSRYVIHTVGPQYNKEPAILLRDAYYNSLQLAEQYKIESIAFPAISTGVYGYPKEEAARVVKEVVSTFPFSHIKKVILCYFSKEDKVLAERIILKS